jgi:O-6-methylguanine DNA methyltransferase
MRPNRETFYASTFNSPVGDLTIVVSTQGVFAVHFGRVALPHLDLIESAELTAACRQELEEYFAGERTRFTLPLDLRGTPFQKQCWQALLDIPYGETRSYAEIARCIGSPRAFRAVGLANHDNPVVIIVPCHRVIGANGSLTGYGGGLDVKRRLLEFERQHHGNDYQRFLPLRAEAKAE